MGVAANVATLMMNTARKSDLELQETFINQQRMQLANTCGSLIQMGQSLEPENPYTQMLQARIAAVQAMDKNLTTNLSRIGPQIAAMTQIIEDIQKRIDKNIQSSFKTTATA